MGFGFQTGSVQDVPTIVDRLASNNLIGVKEVGIYLGREGTNETSALNGYIRFGGSDPSRLQGSLDYIPQSVPNMWVIPNVIPSGL
jgi:Eukaryotic aspartyl protease